MNKVKMSILALMCLLYCAQASEQLIVSSQYSRLIVSGMTGAVPLYVPAAYIIPPFNKSLDPLHATYRSQPFVLPGEADKLEADCLALLKAQYGEDFASHGHKDPVTGSWYLPNVIMAPVWRPYSSGMAKILFDSDNKHSTGVIVGVEATWYFEFQTNGPFGGAKTGAQRQAGMLGTCARMYFYDPDAMHPTYERSDLRSYNPSIRSVNEWGLPVLFNDIRVFDVNGNPQGRLVEVIDYNRNATHYIINSKSDYLGYKDVALL